MGFTFGGGGEGLVEDGENEVDVCVGDAHRRFDAENVSKKTTFADEETAFPALFKNFGDELPIRFLGFAVLNGFYADHQAHAPDISNGLMFFLKFTKAVEQTIPEVGASQLEIVAPNDFASSSALGDGDRISSVGVEMDSLG